MGVRQLKGCSHWGRDSRRGVAIGVNNRRGVAIGGETSEIIFPWGECEKAEGV